MKSDKDIEKHIIETQPTEVVTYLNWWGLLSSVIDKELLKESKELIALRYDKIKTWLLIKNAGVLGIFALLYNTWDNVRLRIIFIISLIVSIIGAVMANRKYNIIFNTLVKKIEYNNKKSKTKLKLGHK